MNVVKMPLEIIKTYRRQEDQSGLIYRNPSYNGDEWSVIVH